MGYKSVGCGEGGGERNQGGQAAPAAPTDCRSLNLSLPHSQVAHYLILTQLSCGHYRDPEDLQPLCKVNARAWEEAQKVAEAEAGQGQRYVRLRAGPAAEGTRDRQPVVR